MADRPSYIIKGASWQASLVRPAVTALAGAVLLSLAGAACVLRVASTDASTAAQPFTPTPVSITAPGGNWHDLAIISLDFDPPLKPGEVLAIEHPPAMLVAVDNKGNQTESPVVVRLRLTGADGSDAIATDEKTISSLAQGEAKVVRFDGLTSLPSRPAYIVHVDVQPAPGEVSLADNSKEIRVQIVADGEH